MRFARLSRAARSLRACGPFAFLLAVLPACAEEATARSVVAKNDDPRPQVRPADIAAARELDQQGVKSYLDGRYLDADALFRAAYVAGGPPSELWNMARCREKLDDSEGAAGVIQQYLAQAGLAPPDRVEAEQELRTLQSRTSVLTVTSTPEGASLALDGKASGTTPTSMEIHAGSHHISLRMGGYVDEVRAVDARFGRALHVALDLRPLPK
jgi:hypothetical protein